MTTNGGGKRVLALCSSPRREGNSQLLAEAVLEGAAEAGHACELVHLPDHVTAMLRDCRECRDAEGRCTIDDGYDSLFFDKYLPADAVVYATPLWWYGMSGHLKTFIDRFFCQFKSDHPDSGQVVEGLQGKRIVVVMSAEESNLGARIGVLQQMHECCRYLHQDLVGFVTGVANSRGEVRDDPTNPLGEARALGRRLFETRGTDYDLLSERGNHVWGEGSSSFPAQWR